MTILDASNLRRINLGQISYLGENKIISVNSPCVISIIFISHIVCKSKFSNDDLRILILKLTISYFYSVIEALLVGYFNPNCDRNSLH